MANVKSARKRIRQELKRNARNRKNNSRIKSFIKKFKAVSESKDKEKSLQAFKLTMSEIHKGVKKGLYHKNKASRTISKLSVILKSL